MSNNTATFYCSTTGKPIVTITWLKDTLPFDKTNRVDITYSTVGSNCSEDDPPDQCVKSSTVQIYNTTSTDSGKYSCVANNTYGAVNSTLLDLLVKGTHC